MTDTVNVAGPMVTGLFRNRDAAERAFRDAQSLGYAVSDISVIMSDETREREFEGKATALARKAQDSAPESSDAAKELGGPTGGTVGTIAPVIAAIGTAILIPGLGLGWTLGYLGAPEFRPLAGIGMFFGSLWFVALSEEFFFRGLLQRWIGLPAASALFGLAHLGFREFPNWRHVAITVVLGVFCGLAYRRAGSIRAAMVTHSLVNAMWVGLLGKL